MKMKYLALFLGAAALAGCEGETKTETVVEKVPDVKVLSEVDAVVFPRGFNGDLNENEKFIYGNSSVYPRNIPSLGFYEGSLYLYNEIANAYPSSFEAPYEINTLNSTPKVALLSELNDKAITGLYSVHSNTVECLSLDDGKYILGQVNGTELIAGKYPVATHYYAVVTEGMSSYALFDSVENMRNYRIGPDFFRTMMSVEKLEVTLKALGKEVTFDVPGKDHVTYFCEAIITQAGAYVPDEYIYPFLGLTPP